MLIFFLLVNFGLDTTSATLVRTLYWTTFSGHLIQCDIRQRCTSGRADNSVVTNNRFIRSRAAHKTHAAGSLNAWIYVCVLCALCMCLRVSIKMYIFMHTKWRIDCRTIREAGVCSPYFHRFNDGFYFGALLEHIIYMCVCVCEHILSYFAYIRRRIAICSHVCIGFGERMVNKSGIFLFAQLFATKNQNYHNKLWRRSASCAKSEAELNVQQQREWTKKKKKQQK